MKKKTLLSPAQNNLENTNADKGESSGALNQSSILVSESEYGNSTMRQEQIVNQMPSENFPTVLDNSVEKNMQNSSERNQKEKTIYLENNSSSIVWYKPENGSEIYPLEGYSVLYEPIDGVATTKYKNAVIKIPTGSAVTITKEGGAEIHWYGFGEISRLFGYGWIDECPDENWKPLFQKAKLIGKNTY